jgi:hypothetical protein
MFVAIGTVMGNHPSGEEGGVAFVIKGLGAKRLALLLLPFG